MALALAQPLPQFFDIDGSPLDEGSVFFGAVGQNPEINQVTVYWDAEGTQPVAQPVRTKNGYLSRAGTPAQVYTNGDFSLYVKSSDGRLIVYIPNGNTQLDALIDAVTASLTPSVVTANTVADLRLLTGESTLVHTRGYWQALDGGAALYSLQPSASPSPGDNGGLVIERADGRWYSMVTTAENINVSAFGVYTPPTRLESPSSTPGYFNRWTGAKPSAFLAPAFLPTTYSSVDRWNAAATQLRSIGKGALISGVLHADKQIDIAAPLKVVFAGKPGRAAGNLDLNLPDSYIFQADVNMVGSVVLQVFHPGVHFVNGGIVGTFYYDAAADFYFPQGPARDGIFIGGNSFRWDNGCICRMGRDGWRIGDYSGGAGTNANSVRLDGCTAAYNGNNGLTVNDDSGSLDANAFQIDGLFSHHNFNSGIELANTYLGGLFNAPVVENNGRGWFINSTATGVVIVGGDTEANTGWRGDLPFPYTVATPLNNRAVDPAADGLNHWIAHTVQGVVVTDLSDGTRVKKDHDSSTELSIGNTNTGTNASATLVLSSSAGDSGIRKFAAAVGGDLQIGNDGAFPLIFKTNALARIGLNANGALLANGAADTGTPGQVLTSAGSGGPPVWASSGGGGGGSPLTTKGDLFTYSTLAARLPVGTNGQVLTADSAESTGLKWSTVTGTGTVTSVAMTVPTGLSVSGSPITAAGTLALTYAAGYQGFLSSDKTKLDSITVANLALLSASNVFTGATQSITLSTNAPIGFVATNVNAGSGALAQFVAESDAGPGGIRQLSVAAGGQTVFGNYIAQGVALMQNSVFRIYIDNSGNLEFRGLPGASGGNPERVWRDGSGYLRIG